MGSAPLLASACSQKVERGRLELSYVLVHVVPGESCKTQEQQVKANIPSAYVLTLARAPRDCERCMTQPQPMGCCSTRVLHGQLHAYKKQYQSLSCTLSHASLTLSHQRLHLPPCLFVLTLSDSKTESCTFSRFLSELMFHVRSSPC